MSLIGFCFAESLRGRERFQNFKKANYCHGNERSKHPFSNTIKWKESNGPHWVLLRRVPSGDKTFSRFQKGGLPPVKRKVQTPFLKHNKMERIKWTPLGSASQSPFGG